MNHMTSAHRHKCSSLPPFILFHDVPRPRSSISLSTAGIQAESSCLGSGIDSFTTTGQLLAALKRLAGIFERLRSRLSRRNSQGTPRGPPRSGKPATICVVLASSGAHSVYNLPAPSPDASSFGTSWLLPETCASEARVLFDKPLSSVFKGILLASILQLPRPSLHVLQI